MLSLFSRKRQRGAFEREALPHLDALHAYALRLCHDRAEAEDLVQETFLRALDAFHRYEEGTNCKAWLFRILTNAFFNRQRARKRRTLVEADALPEIEVRVAEHYQDQGIYRPLEAQALDHIVSRHLDEALQALPAEFRTVLLLADLEDLSYREIADVVGCPVGTVMSRLYRARKAMQRHLLAHATAEGIVAERAGEEVADLDEFRRRRRAEETAPPRAAGEGGAP